MPNRNQSSISSYIRERIHDSHYINSPYQATNGRLCQHY